ncbi:MAG: response regulator [Rhodoferax sp.]|uniref:hybrid sensor histidine kinase/response regulator n=1 Tax=Rhodoferax sp. TaxID=50421 RepID=UPI001B589F3B|nr:response regulator [Rhodoferax sp.]MBP9906613.1 response regulator [Rhodoferax sp.]
MNKSDKASNSVSRWSLLLARWLPRSLSYQVMLLTSVCLALCIMGYGYYRAVEETASTKRSITAQMLGLAKNLATVDAYFLRSNDPAQIETLTLHTATVDGIYSVLVTDVNGKPLSEVVNKNGVWSPRFNASLQEVPGKTQPDTIFETRPHSAAQRDFLAGTAGTMSAWHRIGSAQDALGWVRINYRLDTFDAIADRIRLEALQAVLLAVVGTVALLYLLLRPTLRALKEATGFAGQLNTTLGSRLTVSHLTSEVEALGTALNALSQRLLSEHTELSNQKFALDQHAIVSTTDLSGNITYANQRFCDISGYQVHELMGQNHRIVKSDEHDAALFEQLWHTVSHGQVWRGEIKNRRKDGSFYWVNATIVPLLGQDGLPSSYIGIRTDITANKAMQQHLLAAREDAEAAMRAKGHFLANMSHEIRTPMNAVLGMLKLIQNTDLTKRQLDYIVKADSAARSLLGLLNDILDFSKIDAGKMSLESRAFRVDKLMRDLSVILSANLGAKPVEVLFDLDPAVPRALMGDVLRLQQVLINLSGNAIKFTAQGEVVISIRVTQRNDNGVGLRFAVRDSGIGIAPENQKHIFDGFSQAEASTTRRFGGTGLGLTISRRLVALMGGELSLDSELGVGSTFAFTITLPLALEHPRAVLAAPFLPANLSVLVVDDNPTARHVLGEMAKSLGWQADLASGGLPALELVQKRRDAAKPPYQAVFVDWQMPGMDGWETITRLQAGRADDRSPVIVMVTANGREMLGQRSTQEQAQLDGFLVKPITASMLYDAVAEALAEGALDAASASAVEPAAQPLLGMRLLVVEDNIINQQVAQEMLTHEGATVELAENGQLGVEAVHRAFGCGQSYDAVLMDIQMPVMDGYTATRLLRQDAALAKLPIIAMTANAMASDREACLAAGMDAHIGKPFKLAELVELLLKLARPATRLSVMDNPGASRLSPSQPPEPALPRLDAVDMAGALERLGGNSALYARVLQSYLSDIVAQPDLLDQALGCADWLTAQRILHTLKGLSATVGATYMAAVARQSELTIKAISTPGSDADALDIHALAVGFRAAVSATQAVMAHVARTCLADADGTVPASDVTVGDGKDGLRQLWALLKSSDMGAWEVFERLQRQAPIADTRGFATLSQAMAVFDFAQAAQACEALLNER